MRAANLQRRRKDKERPQHQEKLAQTKMPTHWKVTLPDGRWVFVEAADKSGARSAAKKLLQIRGTLPSGTLAIAW